MSLFQKVRVTVLGNINELLDKTIDYNSIPVVKQYIRDLEDGIARAKHEAAVSASQVTNLQEKVTVAQANIATHTKRAQAFLSKNDEANARTEATAIKVTQDELTALQDQLKAASEGSKAMDAAVQQLQSQHTAMMQQLRKLQSEDGSAKAFEQVNRSLKAVAQLNTVDGQASVDNLTERIHSRSLAAREEFNRTVADMTPAPDPLHEQAVDDILNSLRTPEPVTK